MKSLGECSQLNYGAPEEKSDQMECVISSGLEVGSIKRLFAPLVSPFDPHPLIVCAFLAHSVEGLSNPQTLE